MFDFTFDASTKKTAGQLAVGSGVALLVYNKFERPSAPMGLPLALIGGGMAVLVLTSSESAHSFASGPQEAVDHAALVESGKWAAVVPWLGLGAIVGVGALMYARATG
jgi:hypothetical protein